MSREEYFARKNKVDQEVENISAKQSKYAKAEVDIQKYFTRCFAALTNPYERWKTCLKAQYKLEFQLMEKSIESLKNRSY